eukprot:4206071-Pyramimonas_sp.AAC.1
MEARVAVAQHTYLRRAHPWGTSSPCECTTPERERAVCAAAARPTLSARATRHHRGHAAEDRARAVSLLSSRFNIYIYTTVVQKYKQREWERWEKVGNWTQGEKRGR